MKSFAGLFLFNCVIGDEDPGTEPESPLRDFGILSRNGDEGDDGAELGEEEDCCEGCLRCVRFRLSGVGEIIEVLLQNRDGGGENTGELDTATEHDISLSDRVCGFFLKLAGVLLLCWFWMKKK